jgi:hypothetical protein
MLLLLESLADKDEWVEADMQVNRRERRGESHDGCKLDR